MKANELRIGNLINAHGSPMTIIAEDILSVANYEANSEAIQPIPLTEEWLKRFGFNMNPDWNHEPNYGATALLDLGYLRICRNMMGGIMLEDNKGISTGVGIDYVHQLQNLYFALTQQELTFQS